MAYGRGFLLLSVLSLTVSAWPTPSVAQDDLSATPYPEEAAAPQDRSIATDLADGITKLDAQIAIQQSLLKTAQTPRERQMITGHIRFLEQERATLEDLLHELVGPRFHVREAAREQQSERRSERYDRQLERDERFPP